MRVTIPELSLVLLIDQSDQGSNRNFAARHFLSTEVLHLDAVRAMVCDDEVSERAAEAGWDALLELAARRLSLGRFTVVEGKGLNEESRRRPLLDLAAEHHTIPVAILLGSGGDESGLEREGFRHVLRFATTEEGALSRIRRQRLWNDQKGEAGPFDVVGPVYGRYGELVALLSELRYQIEPMFAHPEGRKLVFLGDLVDHGSGNADVLRLVMKAVDAGVAFAVPGNHDARLVAWLRKEKVQEDAGMQPTIAEFASAPADFRQQALTFLESSVSHYLLDGGQLVVAHAGLREELQGRGSNAVRAFSLAGESPGENEKVPAEAPKWVIDYQGAARVVYAHPLTSEPLWLNNTVNLAVPGQLTALRYPEMRIVKMPVKL